MEHKSGPGSQQPHSPHSIPASPASAELRDPSAHRPLSPMARATSSLRAPLLRAALLLLLLTSGQKGSGASLASELRCQCLKTVPGVHPKSIQSVKVSAPGPHCTQTEVIALLKNGQEVCLNPESPMVQKIIHKLLNSFLRTVIPPAEQGEEEAHAAVPETDLALLRQS